MNTVQLAARFVRFEMEETRCRRLGDVKPRVGYRIDGEVIDG